MSQLTSHPFFKHNTQLNNSHALLGNRISLIKMQPYHPFSRPTVHCWEQSSNGGQGRTQPPWSCPHLQPWSGAGALSPFTHSQIRTRIPPLCQEAFRAASLPEFAGSSLLYHGNFSLPQNYKREEKTHIPKTAPQTFSKLGDCSSAPYESHCCPQSNSLILISDTEFHSSCTNITLLYQNVVYQKSGLFARIYCLEDQFYIYSCDIQLPRIIKMLIKILTHSLCQAEIF